MGIEFTIASKNLSFIRPLGYGFPNGLTGRPAIAGIDAIIIAGGGSGGAVSGQSTGGGGAGGFVQVSNSTVTAGTALTVSVGGGGDRSVV